MRFFVISISFWNLRNSKQTSSSKLIFRCRFGANGSNGSSAAAEDSTAPKVTTNPGSNSVVLDEKMKKRAERFGMTA